MKKSHIPPEKFTRKLREAGISDAEPGESQAEENLLEQLSLMALTGSPKLTELIDKTLENLPEEAIATEKGKTIYAYFNFLKNLAIAGNKDVFLKKANKKMVKMLMSMVKEEADQLLALEKILRQLSLSVLKGVPGIEETLDNILTKFTKDQNTGEEGNVFFNYFSFLKDLTQAEDRVAFLKQADGEMVEMLMSMTKEEEK